MSNWSKIRLFLWVLSLPFVSLILVSSNDVKWLTLLSILCIIAIAYIYIYNERKYIEQRYNRKLHDLEHEHLNMLSHQRHDAMNDIQILLSYIRLDKKDKCIAYVDKIKARAQMEGAIAKLNDYQLIHYINELKLCNWEVKFDIELISNKLNWKNECSLFLIKVISCYKKYAINEMDGEQLLSVYVAIDDQIYIQFEYNGQLLDNNAWKAEIEAETAKLVHEQRIILTIDEQDINSTFLA